MFSLLPHRAKSIDGRRHVYTAPVRLRRAQNDEHAKHEDGHFATATIRYIKDLVSIFGNDCVFYLSQDDKCKVPLGLPAARIQAPMLMHLDYRVQLPDHDWTVAPRHQLIPRSDRNCFSSDFVDLLFDGLVSMPHVFYRKMANWVILVPLISLFDPLNMIYRLPIPMESISID
jgi:hypothetical protein